MADRDGAVAAGPPSTSVADDPGPDAAAATPTAPAGPVVEQRKGEQPPSFFDQPVREPELAGRVVLDASPADVVVGAQAETTELRAALDDLRRVLDDVDSATITPRRRRGPTVAMAGGVAAVVVAGLVVGGAFSGDDTTGEVTTVSAPSASASGAPSAPSSLPSSAPASAPSTAPASGPSSVPASPGGSQPSIPAPAALPSSGPGVTEPGSTAVLTIDTRTGDLDVYEQFMAATPQSALPLSLVRPSGLQGDVAGVRPAVQGAITVLLDGRQARAVPAGDRAWVAAPPNGGARFQRAVLKYRVTGAFTLSKPARPGRGFILFSALSGGAGLQLGQPVRAVTVGPEVVGIVCPSLPSAGVMCLQPQQGQARTALVPAGSPDALMMLTVNLPQAS